jgi:hypothetical protein
MIQEIITGIKKDDGVHIIWQKGKETRSTFFWYSELIAMQINALDLIEHPKNYVLNEEFHTVTMRGRER